MDYEAANKYLKRRLSVATTLGSGGISAAVDAQLRQRCFFSARVAEARVLRALRRISDAHSRGDLSLAEARTLLKRWLDREHPGERDPDDNRITNLGSTARLDLILRQNAAQAAAVGRYEVGMDPDIMEIWPNWRYVAHPDARPTHAALDGMIRPKTDPIWRRVFPPWDFNCRCDVEDEEGEATDPPGFRIETPESGYRFDPAEALRYSLDDVEDPETRKIAEEQIKLRFGGKLPEAPEAKLKQRAKPAPAPKPLQESKPKAETPEEHRIRRQAQWEAAYDKRRDAWHQSILDAGGSREIAGELAELYTPKLAKLGKPPKLVFKEAKEAFLTWDGKTMQLHPDPTCHYGCAGCARHEFGHWIHGVALRKGLVTKTEIETAVTGDWKRIKAVYAERKKAGVGGLRELDARSGSNAFYNVLARSLYGKEYVELDVNRRYAISGVMDPIGSISDGAHGMGHTKEYYKRQNQGPKPYSEAIANINSIRKYMTDEQIKLEFPNLYAILVKMEAFQ